MSKDLLQEVACPNCRNPIDIREHGRHVTCDACSSQFILHGHLCPNCGTYHRQEEVVCGRCATPLKRTCRKCSTSNWAGDEYCVQCGAALDIFDLLSLQGAQSTTRRLEEQRAMARELKAQEEVASQKRMAELMAIEEQRQAEVKERIQKQKVMERNILILVFSGVGLFLLCLVLYAVFSSLF